MQAPLQPQVGLRTLLALSWPIVISRASQTVIGLSDTLLVAHLGAAALAATATGALNSFMLLILPMGTTFIVSSFAAQLFGRGDAAGARRFGWYGLVVAAFAQLLCVVAWPFIGDALKVFHYDPDVHRLMTGYLQARLVGGGAAIGVEALANYFGGIGRTRPGMVANVVAMTLNVAGNWLLIDGHWGLPALGVQGSGLASALATSAAFFGFGLYFFFDGSLGEGRLRLSEFVRLLRFGVPSGVNWLFEFGAFMFFANVVVGGLGTPTLAAMSAILSITSASFMPAFGVASAGAILVGQAIGAGQKDTVPRVARLAVSTAAVWQGLAGLVCIVAPNLLIAPFAQGEGAAEVAAIGARMLMISAAWQVFDATSMCLAEALRGAGDTFFPMVARIAVAWLFFVPGSYLAVNHFGGTDVAAMSWLVAYLALLAAVLVLRFRSGAWRSMELVEPTV